MATLMITGGKIGSDDRPTRAFAIGCVIYGAGSFTTALAPNLAVLIIGWSFLEGIGAALIMPAIVALVASNFAAAERPRAYGLVAAAGAIAVAAGPLIGGAVTTYWSWRLRVRRRGASIVVVDPAADRAGSTTSRRRSAPASTSSASLLSAPASAWSSSASCARASGAGCTPKPGGADVARALARRSG